MGRAETKSPKETISEQMAGMKAEGRLNE